MSKDYKMGYTGKAVILVALVCALAVAAHAKELPAIRTYTVTLANDEEASAEKAKVIDSGSVVARSRDSLIRPTRTRSESARARKTDAISALEAPPTDNVSSDSPVVSISRNYAVTNYNNNLSTSTTTTESVIELLDRLRKLPPEALQAVRGREGETGAAVGEEEKEGKTETESVLQILNEWRERVRLEEGNSDDEAEPVSVQSTTNEKTTNNTSSVDSITTATTAPPTTFTSTAMLTPVTTTVTTTVASTTATTTTTTEQSTSPTTSNTPRTTTSMTTQRLFETTTTSTTSTTTLLSTTEVSSSSTGGGEVEAFTGVPLVVVGNSPATTPEEDDDADDPPAAFWDSRVEVAVLSAAVVLLCLVAAATLITCCVCRNHFSRKNIYTTMEAEPPKFFTKPGPPVILSHEVGGRAGRGGDDVAIRVSSNRDKVTEL